MALKIDKVLILQSADNQDRLFDRHSDFVRHTAEEEASEPAHAMGTHDEQVNFIVFHIVDDPACCIAFKRDRFDLDRKSVV